MNDEELDTLLGAAGAASQEGPMRGDPPDAIDDGLLLALHRGELDEEAAEAVHRQLAADPEARARLAALAEPVPDAMLDGAFEAWATDAAGAAGPSPDNVVPLFGGRAPILVVAGAVAALAAALAVYLLPSETALPDYALTGLEGAVRLERSDEGAATREIRSYSKLTVTLSPSADVAPDRVNVALYAARGDAPLTKIRKFRKESGPTGVLRLRLEAGDAFDTPGEWTLFVIVAPGALPELGGEARDTARARTDRAQWIEQTLRLRSDGGDP